MNELERAAYIQAMASCAIVEALGMVSENTIRQQRGEPLAYNDTAFTELQGKYGISHNAVISFLRG